MSGSQGHDDSAVVHATHDDAHDASHGPSVGIYLTIFGCLAFLTFITVFISRVHMPPVPAVIIAFLIAICKATLVIAFFMHLKYDPKVMRMMCVVPVVLTMIAMMALMPDIALHGPQAAGPPEVAAQVISDYDNEMQGHGTHSAAGEAGHASVGEGEAGTESSENGAAAEPATEPAASADQQAPTGDAKESTSK